MESVYANNEVGKDLCGCQPAIYEMTLDFSITCDQRLGSWIGIEESSCSATGATDLTPVRVTEIVFMEFNSDFTMLQRLPISGVFQSGDVVTYTSTLAIFNDFTDIILPKKLQVILSGVNAMDVPIEMDWFFTFTNECGIVPVLSEGDQQGWVLFVSCCGQKLLLFL